MPKKFLYSIAEAYISHQKDGEDLSEYCFVFPNKRSGVFFHHAFARVCHDLEQREKETIRARLLAENPAAKDVDLSPKVEEAYRLTDVRKMVKVAHPATTTITDFVEEMAQGMMAERMELVFLLYKAYRQFVEEQLRQVQSTSAASASNPSSVATAEAGADTANALDFNRFQRWADMLLADFNDVDMALVDPEEIFPNVERFREISANYISPEVMEEIQRHWKIDKQQAEYGKEFGKNFWNHIIKGSQDVDPNAADPEEDTNPHSATIQFFQLWRVMLGIYRSFNTLLDEKELLYAGKAHRKAIENLADIDRGELPYKRYIFVGFNVLTPAEKKIFSILRKKGYDFADFYFDDAAEKFMDGPAAIPASKYISQYIKEFPSLFPNAIEKFTTTPKIEILGIASRIGQAQLAGGICAQLYPKDTQDLVSKLRQTAIVLPQETMAQGVLASLPTYITPINLTMGYKLRDSRTAAFVRDIISMHLRSRKTPGSDPTFFYEDVLRVITHPLIQQLNPTLCARIVYEINVNRMYNIEESFFDRINKEWEAENAGTHLSGLGPVFSYVAHHDSPQEVFEYFENLFSWMECGWEVLDAQMHATSDSSDSSAGPTSPDDDPNEEKVQTGNTAILVDRVLTRAYQGAVKRLRSLTAEYLSGQDGVNMTDTTMFHLLERLIGGETLHYEGRPLKGLQVMGVLEARNLDFDNLIIPSMNERIFPRKHYQKSFIPPHLRSFYGMSTQEHQESIYAYYFYRMISRAKKVYLLYDTRTQGTGGGQMSRYLAQLVYLHKLATPKAERYSFTLPESGPLEVRKTDEIMEVLRQYIPNSDSSPIDSKHDNRRYLSASSINQYINCPLSFYLSYIAGFKRENEYHDYMDESTYGTIVHAVLEKLYKQEKLRHPQQRFNRDVLDAMSKREVELGELVTKQINRFYNRKGEECLDPLRGDAEIFGKLITKYVKLVLKNDGAFTFDFLHGELERKLELTLKDEETAAVSCSSSDRQSAEKDSWSAFQDAVKIGAPTEITVNFKYTIDRVDHVYFPDLDNCGRESVRRIIDYKTGSDSTDFGSVQALFDTKAEHRPKAILQLFLYCQAYAQSEGYHEPIMPYIYPIRKVATQGFEPLKMSNPAGGKAPKIPIEDYRDYVDEFNKKMISVLTDLFNKEIPFMAAQTDEPCAYCEFREICRRKKKDNSF